VPLEGQWQRQHTPLRRVSRRELRVLAAVAAVLALAAAIVLYAALHHATHRVAAGCVEVSAASTTGGATLHACGPDAARWCRSQAGHTDTVARAVLTACARAGYRVP
jgi:hypothetical protein